MPSIETLNRVFVYEPRSGRKAAKADGTPAKPKRLGRVHNLVFSPNGRRVVGILVRRPDVAGMVKRDDLFVAWDRLAAYEGGGLIVAAEAGDAYDEKAIERLGLPWDRCIIWESMDVATAGGKVLGRVTDITFDGATGDVDTIFATDGQVAASLVGSVPIPPELLRGVRSQTMIVADEAEELELTGGMAAKAGEGFARAREKGAEVVSQAGTAAGKLLDKGSFALGRAIGQAKNAIADAMEPEPAESPAPAPARDVLVEAPAAPPKVEGSAGEPPIFSVDAEAAKAAHEKPAAKPTATAQAQSAAKPEEPSAVDAAAQALGRQLGKTKTMFSEFLKEFNEASR